MSANPFDVYDAPPSAASAPAPVSASAPAPAPNPFDKFDDPANTTLTDKLEVGADNIVGAASSAGNAIGAGVAHPFLQANKYLGLGLAGMGMLGDSIHSSFSDQPETGLQDAAFRNFVDPANQMLARNEAYGNDAAHPTASGLGFAAGNMGGQLTEMLASGGATEVPELVGAGEDAISQGAQMAGNALSKSAAASAPVAAEGGLDTGEKVYDQTGDPLRATVAGLNDAGITTLTNAMPVGMDGPLLQRLGAGAASGFTGGELQRDVGNMSSPKQTDFSWGDAAQNTLFGAVMGGAFHAAEQEDPNVVAQRFNAVQRQAEAGDPAAQQTAGLATQLSAISGLSGSALDAAAVGTKASQDVLNSTHEDLMQQSSRYREIFDSAYDMTPEEAQDYAKTSYSAEAGSNAAWNAYGAAMKDQASQVATGRMAAEVSNVLARAKQVVPPVEMNKLNRWAFSDPQPGMLQLRDALYETVDARKVPDYIEDAHGEDFNKDGSLTQVALQKDARPDFTQINYPDTPQVKAALQSMSVVPYRLDDGSLTVMGHPEVVAPIALRIEDLTGIRPDNGAQHESTDTENQNGAAGQAEKPIADVGTGAGDEAAAGSDAEGGSDDASGLIDNGSEEDQAVSQSGSPRAAAVVDSLAKSGVSLPVDAKGNITVAHGTAPDDAQAAIDTAAGDTYLEPTPAQAAAGNYRKGGVLFKSDKGDVRVRITTPDGAVRKGPSGSRKIQGAHAGYIPGTQAGDGNPVGVLLTHNAHDDTRPVAVIRQHKPDGSDDQVKVVMGAKSRAEALQVYSRQYPPGMASKLVPNGKSDVTMMDRAKFVRYLNAGPDVPPHPVSGMPQEHLRQPSPEAHHTDFPITEVPLEKLSLSKDVPQFKSGANDDGVVEPLGGKYDRRGTGPIQVWERNDGRMEIISGRHRFDLAKRSGEKTIPAQIYRESEGFTTDHAASLDAELNIRDGQGKVKDYVQYFQNPAVKETALARGLLARSTGQRAYSIATQGSPELIAAHSADRITDEAAVQIAKAAPGDEKMQALGMKLLQDGKSITTAVNTMHAVRTMAPSQASGDMFGFDDSAIQDGIKMAGAASKHQRDIAERLAAITGASKRPELAKKEGIDVHNPKALAQRIAQLKAERDEWENWATDPDKVEAIRQELGMKASKPDPLAADEARLADYKKRADAGDGFYKEVYASHRKQIDKQRAALDAFAEHGDGTTLKVPGEDRWTTVMPDTDGGGKYRLQHFDRKGFSGHAVFNSAEEAAIEAGRDNYTEADPGRMDELATTKEWKRGMEVNAIIQKHQGNFELANADYEKLKAKHDAEDAATGAKYPLAPAGKRYAETNKPITQMTPDAFLSAARPLDIDEESRDAIEALKDHVRKGGSLDPLHLYANGKEDGRHRAVMAKELGMDSVPVVDERTSSSDMFGGPKAADRLDAATRAKDALRNGKVGGKEDTGDGGLFDGKRPEQIDLAKVAEGDTVSYGKLSELRKSGVSAPAAAKGGRRAIDRTDPDQIDLFTPSEAPHAGNPSYATKLLQHAKLVSTGTFKSGVKQVKTWQDAAHIIAPLRKSPQEQVLAVVTDKAGRPLAVVRHTVGLIDQSGVHSGHFIGTIADVPGARNVWFAHNHPSGRVQQSAADLAITGKMERLLKETGIEAHGMIVVAPGSTKASYYKSIGGSLFEDGRADSAQHVTAASRSSEVPMLERRYRKILGKDRVQFANPRDALDWVKENVKGNQEGLIMLDHGHQVVGWMPMSETEMGNLRTGNPDTGFLRVSRDMTRGNAVAGIIVTNKADLRNANNLASAMLQSDFRALDIVTRDEDGQLRSSAGAGKFLGGSERPVYASLRRKPDLTDGRTYVRNDAEGAVMVPLDKLHANYDVSAQDTARKLMMSAAKGEVPRRQELALRDIGNGNFEVLKGADTLAIARSLGVKSLPGVVVDKAGPESFTAEKGILKGDGAKQLTALYSEAARYKPKFDAMVRDTADATGAVMHIEAPLKGRARAEQKAVTDYAGDPTRIKDLLRATLVYDTPEQARAGMAKWIARSKQTVVSQSDTLDNEHGYRDGKVVLQDKHGVKSEVQFHVRSLFEAKESQGHALYKRWRELDPNTPEAGVLNDRMNALYDEAWARSNASNLDRKPNSSSNLSNAVREIGANDRSQASTASPVDTLKVGPPGEKRTTGMSSEPKSKNSTAASSVNSGSDTVSQTSEVNHETKGQNDQAGTQGQAGDAAYSVSKAAANQAGAAGAVKALKDDPAHHAMLVAHARTLAATWKGAGHIEVLHSPRELPEDHPVRQWTQDVGLPDDIDMGGVYYNGKAYLFSDALRDKADATRVMLHEMVGHGGMLFAFGDKYEDFLDSIHNTIKDKPLYKDIKSTYEASFGPREPRLHAHEYLAALSEKADTPDTRSTWNKIIGALRSWMKSQPLLREAVKGWTDNDLETMVRKNYADIRDGRVSLRGMETPTATFNDDTHITTSTYLGARGQRGFVDHFDDGSRGLRVGGLDARIHSTVVGDRNMLSVSQLDTHDPSDLLGLTRFAGEEGKDGVLIGKQDVSRGTLEASGIPFRETPGHFELPASQGQDSPMYSLRNRAKGDAKVEEILKRTIAHSEYNLNPWDRMQQMMRDIRDHIVTGDTALDLKQSYVDALASIAKLERNITGGNLLDASESAYKAAWMAKNNEQITAGVMKLGVPSYVKGSFVPVDGRKGLMEIFKPLYHNTPDGKPLDALWEGYAYAKRAQELIQQTNADGTPREKLMSQDDIDTMLSLEKQYPQFKQVLDDYTAFNHQLLDLAVDRGAMSQDTADLWKQNSYVPFYRALDEKGNAEGEKWRSGKSLSGKKVTSMRLHGSARQAEPIIENIIKNAGAVLDKVYSNEAMRRVVAVANGVGMERLKLPGSPVNLSVGDIEKTLAKIGMHVGGKNESGRYTHYVPKEDMDKLVSFFKLSKPVGPDVVSVMEKGRPVYYRVTDPLLLRSITAFTDVGKFDKALGVILGVPKRLLTMGVTLDPRFMYRNMFRDGVTAWMQTGTNPNIIKGVLSSAKEVYTDGNFVNALRVAGYNGNEYFKVNEMREHLAEMHGDEKLTLLNSPKKLYHAYHRIGFVSEQTNRVTIAKHILAQGGSMAEAAWQAQNTLNFQMRGDNRAMQLLIRAVPFMNARIQGLNRLYEGIRGRDVVDGGQKRAVMSFLLKAAALTTASTLLAVHNEQDPRFQRIPEASKDMYYHFFVGDQHFMLPKPFELGSLLGTLPERALRVMQGKDTKKIFVQSIDRMLFSIFQFDPTPQVVAPYIQDQENQDSLTNNPIVSQTEQDKLPTDQFKPTTSPTIKAISKALPSVAPDMLRSPDRLQHLVQGYTGTIGTYALMMADAVARATGHSPAAPASRYGNSAIGALEGTFGLGDANTDPRTKYLQALYDAQSTADKTATTLRDYIKTGRIDEAKALINDNKTPLAYRATIHTIAKEMSVIRSAENAVYQSPTMTAQQKRQRLDSLNATRVKILDKLGPMLDMINDY
jgi:hypothetical protein